MPDADTDPLTLYRAHQHLAERIGRAHAARTSVHGGDLMQAARLGLWQACLRWDPTRMPSGAGFTSYAVQRIRWAVLDGWRDIDHLETHHRRAIKRGDTQPVTLSAADWLDPASHAPDPADVVAIRMDAFDALWHLACLPRPTRDVFARYALNDEPLAAIAADYGKPDAWAYYQRRIAVQQLRRRLAA